MIVELVYLVIFIGSARSQNISASFDLSGLWPYNLTTVFPFRTLSPVNVDTWNTHLINVPSPLTFNLARQESYLATNDGLSVHVTPNCSVSSFLTGGVLGNATYVFNDLTFFWNGDHRNDAANKIDNIGSPLHVRWLFRNNKYPNETIGKYYRDGFAAISFNIFVANFPPNPIFIPLEKVLKSIKTSGSKLEVPSSILFGLLEQLPKISSYYAYPGSIMPEPGNPRTQNDVAIVIQLPNEFSPYISFSQYMCFLELLSPTETPIANVLPTHHRLGRPMVKVFGVKQIYLP